MNIEEIENWALEVLRTQPAPYEELTEDGKRAVDVALNYRFLLREIRGLEEKSSHLEGVVTAFEASPKTISADLQKAFNKEHSRAERLQKENDVLREKAEELDRLYATPINAAAEFWGSIRECPMNGTRIHIYEDRQHAEKQGYNYHLIEKGPVMALIDKLQKEG